MYTIFRRRTTTAAAVQGGEQTTSYEISWQVWIPIAISALPAIAAFGNFMISVGIHAGWWK